MKKMITVHFTVMILTALFAIVSAQTDPGAAPHAQIDRFSAEAGHLFIRDESNGLPEANMPVDFDQGPFITKGLGPDSELISYYNFDVQLTEPAPIYVLFREGESTPVEDQMNIIDVIPGDEGYNDFWEVQKVTVPADYIANTLTSYSQISDSGYTVEETTILVNCPVVPEGSTAQLRYAGESPELTLGWYKGMVVYYFNFLEKALMSESDMVPTSPIYVTFNINPDQPGGGPGSGFVTEEATGRTHNVASTLPEDETYSPLWRVNVYDNADFAGVHDLASAQAANILAGGIANVNCPIVLIDTSTPVKGEESSIPLAYRLSQNYPNPFNPSTTIAFSLKKTGLVHLSIYNLLGQEVMKVVDKELKAGQHRITIGASNLGSGVYFYKLSVNEFTAVKKMMVLK